MNKMCPECKKTILINNRTHTFRKCKNCDYKEGIGLKTVRDKKYEITLDEETGEEVPKLKKGDLPSLDEPKRKWIPSKMTEKEKEELWFQNEMLKKHRKNASIERHLKKLRQNKYGLKKGTKIRVEGKVYEI